MSSAPPDAPLEKRLAAWFSGVALMVALVIAVFAYNSRQLTGIRAWVKHTYEVKGELQDALTLLLAMDTEARGFALTGQELFLGSYDASRTRINRRILRIKELTKDNARQQEDARELERQVAAKLAFTDEVVRLTAAHEPEKSWQLISTGKGVKAMEAATGLIREMQAEEDRLLQARQTKSETVDLHAQWLSGALAAILVAVLAGAYRLVRFHLAEQRQAENERDRFFTAALDLLCVARTDGYFKRVNPAFTQTLGWSAEELLAKPFLEFVHPEDRGRTVDLVQDLAAGKVAAAFDNRYLRKDGSWRIISWKALPEEGGFIFASGRDVTDLRQAAMDLRSSEQNLTVTLNSIGDGVLATDASGKITRMNPVAEQLTGWSLAEARGQPVGEVFRILNEQSRQAAVLPVEKALATGEMQDLSNHMLLISRDGTERPIADSASPIRDSDGAVLGVVVVFRDVTQTRAAEKALRASEEYNRSIVESSDDSLEVLNVAGRLLDVGGGGRRLSERTEVSRLRDVEWLSFWDQESLANARVALAAAQGGGKGRFRGLRPAPGGEPKWWDVAITPIRNAEGKVERLLVVSRDITERKRGEEALVEARNEAERANRTKSEFLSRMSHELRTPMNAILGFAQIIEMGNPPTALREPLSHITKAGRHLLELINEVLDIARIEAGRMSVSVEPVHLREVIEECVALIRPMADQRSIRIQAGLPVHDDRHVLADRQRLKQAVLNLLSNAVKFNRDNGTVTVACEVEERITGEAVEAPAAGEIRRLRLSIADTGYGIPTAELPRLFDPFERLGADRRGIEGSGLGLALTKRLIELMGASIAVCTEENRGTTFSLEFTLVDGPVGMSAEPSAAADAIVSAVGAAHTVLYIEDNLSNLQLIEHVMVHRPQVKLVAAMQGRLGLDLAREHQPRLILLDLNLPDIPGREVLLRLRGEEATRCIPVVIISADATPGEIQRMLSSGAVDYLTKPLDLQKFLSTMDKLLAEEERDPA